MMESTDLTELRQKDSSVGSAAKKVAIVTMPAAPALLGNAAKRWALVVLMAGQRLRFTSRYFYVMVMQPQMLLSLSQGGDSG